MMIRYSSLRATAVGAAAKKRGYSKTIRFGEEAEDD